MSLLGSPAAAGLARTLTDQRLRKWDCFRILDDTLLVVTELITNAVKETPRREIRFRLAREAGDVVVAVWDSSPRLPRPRPAVELTLDTLDLAEDAYDDNGGRGLLIVQSLTSACGCTRDPRGGKWTWARLVP
ncbi:ATP-binding protein [Actinomadura craniellae]|nr:ATP-binding protein [Actinomadura craniellae]